jgi:TRAP transporter 4TM/12TM fusion protein
VVTHSESEQSTNQSRTQRFLFVFSVVAGIYFVMYVSGLFEALKFFIPMQTHRGLFVLTILTILWLSSAEKAGGKIKWYDIILLVFTLVSTGYPILFPNEFEKAHGLARGGIVDVLGWIFLVVCLMEASRRKLGTATAIIFLIIFIYPFVNNYLPGILHGRGYSMERVAQQVYLSEQGILGSITGLASTMIFIFVVFGAFLQASGAGDWFLKLALATTGHLTGGPGKASVIASALFGTISGAPSANVVCTGTFTIPLMKRIGYSPAFAGAVEAVASTGGQIMPPVMGAIAFIIAEWLNISYWKVCLAAAIPAILYYVAIFIVVHQEARRLKLAKLPKSELPPLWPVIKEGWYWVIPIAAIIVLMGIVGMSVDKAGFWGVISVVIVSMFKKESRLTPRRLIKALSNGVFDNQITGIACASVGIVIGSLFITGIGVKLSGAIVDFSGGNLLVLLLLSAGVCFILGMGMPAIPAYIMVVTLVAPALISLGIPPLSAHLFMFYWAMLSFITPPVAQAAFVAGGLARANPMTVGFIAMRIALIAYVVPFAFVYKPALTMKGPMTDIIWEFAAATISTIALACGAWGFLLEKANWFVRIALMIGGFLLLLFTGTFQFTGLAIIVLALLAAFVSTRISRGRKLQKVQQG